MIAVVIGLDLYLSKVWDEEYSVHKAHEHGVAHMNVAFEDNHLYIEFISPAANIVGFEHHPRTEEQKAAVNEAIKTLKDGKTLFILPPGAGGRLDKSVVDTGIEIDADHESEDTHRHEHGEMRKKTDEDESGHEEHHDADKHERHSEFKVEYHFICEKPKKLVHFDVMLFRVFPGIEHIEVQLLTQRKQSAFELTAKKNRITF